MKSIMNKKLLPSLMAAALVTGIGSVSNVQAVHLSEEGMGQVLMAPVYLAGYAGLGHETDIIVTNTRTDTAVKAKLVIRSASSSTEIFDAILYLTPGDVFRGTLYRDADGIVRLRSTDDSIKSPVSADEEDMYTTICSSGCDVYSPDQARATFASIKPLDVPLFRDRIIQQISPSEGGIAENPTDTMTMGHIEVIGVYGVKTLVDKGVSHPFNTHKSVQVPNAPNTVPTTSFIDVVRPMSKFSVAKIFDTRRGGITLNETRTLVALNTMETPAVTRESGSKVLLTETGVPYANIEFDNIRSTDPSWVQLNGAVEVRLPGADRMGYQMYALAGEVWDNVPEGDRFGIFLGERRYNQPQPTFLPHYFDGRVISNPVYDAVGGQGAPESAVGFKFSSRYNATNDTFDIDLDNVVELEHALATQRLQGTYEADTDNNTNLVVTFPTRYRHHRADPCQAGFEDGDVYSRPFLGNGAIRIYDGGFLAYNNSEELPTEAPRITESNVFSGGIICDNGLPADESGRCEAAPNVGFLSLQEVNYYVPNWSYNSGWFEMMFTPNQGYRTGCSYTGVPALGLSHKYYLPLSGSLMTKLVHKPELQNRDYPLFPAEISSEAK